MSTPSRISNSEKRYALGGRIFIKIELHRIPEIFQNIWGNQVNQI